MSETFDTFQQTDEWRDLCLPLQEYYSYEVDYHNWDHAYDITERSLAIADRLRGRGIHIKIGQLATASSGHDVLHHIDHRAAGFATKEQHSMYVMERFLTERQDLIVRYLDHTETPEDYIRNVITAIAGTAHDAKRDNIYALALHRADIENIGGDYLVFVKNAWKLYLESHRTRPDLDYIAWQGETLYFIEKIRVESSNELKQLQMSSEEIGIFEANAIKNAFRMGRLAEDEHRELAETA